MQSFRHIILNILFLIGWGFFYFFEIIIFSNQIIPGDLYSGGKPPDINIYVYTVINLIFIVWYTFLFLKYFKAFFINQITLKEKVVIIGTCISLSMLWIISVGYLSLLISLILNIAHVDRAFWR